MKNLIITVVPISCQRSLIKNNGKCWNAKRMVCHESVCSKKRFSLSDCASVTPKFYREVSAKCVSFKQCSCHKNLTEISAIPEITETNTKLPEMNGNSTVKCDLMVGPICASCSLSKSIVISAGCGLFLFVLSTFFYGIRYYTAKKVIKRLNFDCFQRLSI